jgi:hypothetical protein
VGRGDAGFLRRKNIIENFFARRTLSKLVGAKKASGTRTQSSGKAFGNLLKGNLWKKVPLFTETLSYASIFMKDWYLISKTYSQL